MQEISKIQEEQLLSLSQNKFVQESIAFIRRRQIYKSGDRVLVAVSGGLDSSALLHILSRISRVLSLHVEAVHLNHATRGESSARESLWVQVLAERLHVKLHSLNLESTVDSSSRNQEELRNLRRQALEKLAKSLGFDAIATAHHANDNAETFLMRSISGTGALGLAGMRPKDGIWTKPLLWAQRKELETYMSEHRVAWVEDPSNERTHYFRNYIRHVLFPELEKARVGALRNLSKAAERIEEEESAWETWLDSQMEGPKQTLSVAWLERWPTPLQRRVLRFWLLKKLGIAAAPQLVEALMRGEELIHPSGSFLRSSDMIVFSPETEFGTFWEEPVPLEFSKRILIGDSLAWSFLPGAPLRNRPLKLAMLAGFSRPQQKFSAGTLRFSWDRTPWPLVLRKMTPVELKMSQETFKAFGIPRPYWKQWPVWATQETNSILVSFLGLKILEPYSAQGDERSVSITHFFEESLKPQ